MKLYLVTFDGDRTKTAIIAKDASEFFMYVNTLSQQRGVAVTNIEVKDYVVYVV